jgi:hypothetical protein
MPLEALTLQEPLTFTPAFTSSPHISFELDVYKIASPLYVPVAYESSALMRMLSGPDPPSPRARMVDPLNW